jgi:hypothetical protein
MTFGTGFGGGTLDCVCGGPLQLLVLGSNRFAFRDRLVDRLAGGMLPKIVVRSRRVLSGIALSVIVLALIGHGSAAAAGVIC